MDQKWSIYGPEMDLKWTENGKENRLKIQVDF